VEKCPKKCLSIIAGYQQPDSSKYVDSIQKPVEAAPEKQEEN
jgi:hypothetical protein